MIGTGAVDGDGGFGLAASHAQGGHESRRGRDAVAHRHLTFAIFPVILVVVLARRAAMLALREQRIVRRPIVDEAWVAASTISAFAFMG